MAQYVWYLKRIIPEVELDNLLNTVRLLEDGKPNRLIKIPKVKFSRYKNYISLTSVITKVEIELQKYIIYM